MEYDKRPYMGEPIYLSDCQCEDVFKELLENEKECGRECNMDNCRVGMTYVPMQRWEEIYSPEKALKRGTVFPSLDLPFKGGGHR